MSKFAEKKNKKMIALYGHIACREKREKSENFDRKILRLKNIRWCWWFSFNEPEEKKKRERENTRENRRKILKLRNFPTKQSHNEKSRNLHGELVKKGKCWARIFFYCCGKKKKSVDEHTSEHGALIRAAGKRRKNRYEFFFIVLTFTSEWSKKVFKNFLQSCFSSFRLVEKL